VKDIELIHELILSQPEYKDRFYLLATFCNYQTGDYIRGYKLLRHISKPQDYSNWAIMGCLLSKPEDTAFYRSYFKRLLNKPDFNTSPFVTLILGNNCIVKQQFDLAL